MRAPSAVPMLLLTAIPLLAGGCRDGHGAAEEAPTAAADPWFTEITTAAGLTFVHDSGALGKLHMPEIMGGGVAIFDADGDGDLDCYLTNGNLGLPSGAPTGGGPGNVLFLQDDGGVFVDASAASGLDDPGYGMGVAIGDVDNDGDLDCYLTNVGPDRLYRNRGDGTFEDVTEIAGIDVPQWTSSASFFDYDRDGFLDLLVAAYVAFDERTGCTDKAGRPEYCGPRVFPPLPDVLLHNNGDGTFTDVSDAAGISGLAAAGLGVVCDDFNGDGWPDAYVANDAFANHLWINRGDGTFVEEAVLSGAAFNMHGQPEAGMGLVGADLDNDGLVDLFVTHLSVETNTYYRNLGGDRGFVDRTGEAGLASTSMAYTGFGTAALDVELDGDLDLVVVNGRVNRTEPRADSWVPAPWSYYAEPNLFYLNAGDGRFTLLEAPARALRGPVEVSRGLAAGDLDRDGDVDLLLANVHGPARLYRNDAPRRGGWVAIRAVDPRLRRDAIGARVTIRAASRAQTRTVRRDSSYASAIDATLHFGLGDAASVESVEVGWPDGLNERFTGVPRDAFTTLRRGDGAPLP